MRKPEKLTSSDIERALADSAELARINAAAPTRKRLAQELGPFATCKTPAYVESPDGTTRVNITDEQAAPAENRRRWGLYAEATAAKRELQIARSQRQSTESDHVPVLDVRSGEVREIPADKEARVARKKWARPGRRRRSFFFFGSLK